MTKSPLTKLQKAAQAVSSSKTPQEKIASLSQAFELFTQETKRLEIAYYDLKQQFQSVNLALEETNQKLENKVHELDLVTYYLNSILSNMSQGILFIDLNGTVTTYNSAAEQILGVQKQAVLFDSFWKSFKDEEFGFSMREALSVRKGFETTYISLPIPGMNTSRELEIDTTFVLKETNDAGTPPESTAREMTQGLIVLIRDITEIRHLQSLAERNDRMKELGEMAAMVAHEIRNPLGGIKGFASLLQRDLKDQPELERLATYIIEGTDSLNRLVNNVLDYSRPLQMHFESTDVVALMKEIILHVNADEGVDPRIGLHSASPQESIFAMVDPQVIKSAVLNLVANAIQAMPEGGELDITTELEGNDVLIKVTDTGVGIPPENLKKIYSPFFTTRPDGHGFGLTEVHKVIQGHGGAIEVASTVGKGTTFTIRLPQKVSEKR